jgi:hypothetical protein
LGPRQRALFFNDKLSCFHQKCKLRGKIIVDTHRGQYITRNFPTGLFYIYIFHYYRWPITSRREERRHILTLIWRWFRSYLHAYWRDLRTCTLVWKKLPKGFSDANRCQRLWKTRTKGVAFAHATRSEKLFSRGRTKKRGAALVKNLLRARLI